jgi:hypothetical protein
MQTSYKAEIVRTLREEGYSGHNTAELEERLNVRAAEGWTLHTIVESPTGWLVVYVMNHDRR